MRCAATQPTIGHVPYELLSTCCPRLPSPIAVPDCRPGPKLPNPLSPCNQPPCNRRKSYRAKLDANQTVGFEAARVHAHSSPRTLLVGRIRASGWFAACFRDARFESACVLTAGRQPYCRGRGCPGGGDEDETIRRACKNPVNPILLGSASPLALQVRMGQVRMIRRAAFDPPSRQSRGRRIGGSKSADQGFVFPRRRRCHTG